VVINFFKIGTRDQFPGDGPVPGLALYEGATYVKLNSDTLYINQPALMSVTNISNADIGDNGCPGFYAALVGVAVTGGGPTLIGGT